MIYGLLLTEEQSLMNMMINSKVVILIIKYNDIKCINTNLDIVWLVNDSNPS